MLPDYFILKWLNVPYFCHGLRGPRHAISLVGRILFCNMRDHFTLSFSIEKQFVFWVAVPYMEDIVFSIAFISKSHFLNLLFWSGSNVTPCHILTMTWEDLAMQYHLWVEYFFVTWAATALSFSLEKGFVFWVECKILSTLLQKWVPESFISMWIKFKSMHYYNYGLRGPGPTQSYLLAEYS